MATSENTDKLKKAVAREVRLAMIEYASRSYAGFKEREATRDWLSAEAADEILKIVLGSRQENEQLREQLNDSLCEMLKQANEIERLRDLVKELARFQHAMSPHTQQSIEAALSPRQEAEASE